MSTPLEINLETLEKDTTTFASEGLIDDTSNIANQKVYLFSGEDDITVETGVVTDCQKYFNHFKG